MTADQRRDERDLQLYRRAFAAHDVRFDGRIFMGVSSTGIYCRPVCCARLPKAEHCTFFTSAAAAEAAGYRPCLKCRPELAPGCAPVDATNRLAQQAALVMEDGQWEGNLQDLAQSLGVTDRHLRRTFAAVYGVSPIQYLQTRRLLLAKQLLTDTRLPVTQVAFAAGFQSLRRFNALFASRYRLSPTALRTACMPQAAHPQAITLLLGYRPPYQWDRLLAFLQARAIPGVERVTDETYARTVRMAHGQTTIDGWLLVRHVPHKRALAVTVCEALLPVLAMVLSRVKDLFDLRCNPGQMEEALMTMDEIRPGLYVPGLRVPGCFDAFETAARAVLGQQISVKVARTLSGRVASAYGAKVETPVQGLTHAFPAPESICALASGKEALGALGVTGARAHSIEALARAVVAKDVELTRTVDPQRQMQRLLALPGFGPWTVQVVAMRVLGWPDAFLPTDYGIRKALPGCTPKEIVQLSQRWRPWRAYATMQLWNAL